jgi:hypothetical protein
LFHWNRLHYPSFLCSVNGFFSQRDGKKDGKKKNYRLLLNIYGKKFDVGSAGGYSALPAL